MKSHHNKHLLNIGILLLSFSILASPAQALTANEQVINAAFKGIQANNPVIAQYTVPKWPVANSGLSAIESNFGPRIQSSNGKYDWHRGIDIDAKLGTNVYAAQTGELWKVYQVGNPLYKDGGNVVILRHKFASPLNYGGKTLTYYYTLYMHLNSISQTLINAANLGQMPIVTAGTVIGTVGHTGEPNIADHLHFELRVGTYCQLDFQVANPASSCSKGFMFDPGMNPLLLFAPIANTVTFTKTTTPTDSTDGVFHVSMLDSQPLLNRIEFAITTTVGGDLVKSSVLDFNERTGFDATTTAALDTQNTTVPYISPWKFNDASTKYEADIIIPKSYIATYTNSARTRTLTIEDLWGNKKSIKW